jgi:hypothetical protein
MLLVAAPAIAGEPVSGYQSGSLQSIQDRNRPTYGRAEGSTSTYIRGCNCYITTYPARPGTLRFPSTRDYSISEITKLMGFTPRNQGSVRMSVARTSSLTSSFMADKTLY